MPNAYIVAAGAALTLSVSTSMTFAHSGDLALGKPALPVMTQFDAAPAATGALQAPVTFDSKPSHPTPPGHATPKSARDQFQRYFDSHYRAHLVLDASAHRFFEVE